MGSDVAKELAKKYDYPFDDRENLPRVAQYVAINFDAVYAKAAVLDLLKELSKPQFKDDEPHAVLADLPLPIYLTTNYDSLMAQALQSRHKDVTRETCHWNESLADEATALTKDYTLHPARPIVYHIHGYDVTPQSLVLTEDDYLAFLEAMSTNPDLLPRQVSAAMRDNSLLFIGYRLADLNLRLLLRTLRNRAQAVGFVVIPPPKIAGADSDAKIQERQESQQAYLTKEYAALDLRVYWGTAREFCAQVRKRLAGDS
jgi:hypothetical protein